MIHKIKITLATTLFFAISITSKVKADEGMWIPLLLKQFNEAEMQKLGMKLTAEDIYSINKSSLKDAIVHFDGGCTGEMVSNEGLLLTNHHCGFDNIQYHSTVEHDYLTNGFWAKNKGEELACPGLTCTFIVRIEDITKQVLEGVTDATTDEDRVKITTENSKKIETEAIKGTHYEAKIKPYFFGAEYYMIVTETYKDVRLVGAPPSSIGKFGGDTDNWMWPRHTGDFSVFRIYANDKNEPAEYAATNKPYKPKNFLKIAMGGYKQGDFTLTYGFPGRTFQYLTSYGIKEVAEISNPNKIKIREKRLAIWTADMKESPKVRIQYASKHASVSNYHKKFMAENKGMHILNTMAYKQNIEKDFNTWATKTGNTKYTNLLTDFKNTYELTYPLQLEYDLYNECAMGIELVKYAATYYPLIKLCKDVNSKDDAIKTEVEKLKKNAVEFYKDYNVSTDQKICVAMLKHYQETSKDQYRPPVFAEINPKAMTYSDFVKDIYSRSVFTDEMKIKDLLENFTREQILNLEKDNGFLLMQNIVDNYNTKIKPEYTKTKAKIESLHYIWVKGLREMKKDTKFWPDANSTVRVAYGTVQPYKPFDGATYDYITHLKGVMEKMDNTNSEFTVPLKLQELYAKKDFGPYADATGDVPVAFIATNHTTGGNSGSPLLDAQGRLLGLNFDTSWEGAMSNYHFSENRVRNISVDIRYVLFIMDKFAGAKYLVDEMSLVK